MFTKILKILFVFIWISTSTLEVPLITFINPQNRYQYATYTMWIVFLQSIFCMPRPCACFIIIEFLRNMLILWKCLEHLYHKGGLIIKYSKFLVKMFWFLPPGIIYGSLIIQSSREGGKVLKLTPIHYKCTPNYINIMYTQSMFYF